jgi:hypothetical protein
MVTLVRSAIRGLLRVSPAGLAAEIRAVLRRDDDYVAAGKPPCDWDDAEARDLLIDALVADGYAALAVLEGRELGQGVGEAAELLATVLGQDVEQDDDGRFRIARRVAKDRVISTVDPDARHGRKTSSGRYDGYKGHVAVDPDSEIITQTTVTPANTGDADATGELLAEFARHADDDGASRPDAQAPAAAAADTRADEQPAVREDAGDGPPGPVVYGDAAYGSGENLALLEQIGATAMTKVQPAVAPGGRFSKERFAVDLDAGTVTCPGEHTVALRGDADGVRQARFATLCTTCPLRAGCTTSGSGRTINVGPHERLLADARARQAYPGWQADYRAHRPKVERRLAHLVRRLHCPVSRF